MLLSQTFAAGLTGFDLVKKTATLIDKGQTLFTTSSVAQIGRAIVAVLKNDTETANKVVFVESFTTTQLEVLSALEKVTGEKWTVVNKKSEDVRTEGFRAMGEGKMLEGGSGLIQAAVLGQEALENHTHVEGGIWNAHLGLQKETVEEILRRIC